MNYTIAKKCNEPPKKGDCQLKQSQEVLYTPSALLHKPAVHYAFIIPSLINQKLLHS